MVNPIKTGKEIGVEFIIAQESSDIKQPIEDERFWTCGDLKNRLQEIAESIIDENRVLCRYYCEPQDTPLKEAAGKLLEMVKACEEKKNGV